MNSDSQQLLVIVGSPRRNGNSAALAHAVGGGAVEAGTQVMLRFIDDYVANFLRDCRSCRNSDGECGIGDGFRQLFFDDFLPADGVVFCSPVYWYGLSAQMKAFLDRSFCYYAASYPHSKDVTERMSHKRLGLVLASEETFPGASLGIVHQIQEYARYTNSEFAGTIRGVGNSRGDVLHDPDDPLGAAERFGRSFFERKYSDYRIDTPRRGRVWAE